MSDKLCRCDHRASEHISDGAECVCVVSGCDCKKFLQAAVLADPNGHSYEVACVRRFVREHQELFSPDDPIKRQCPSHRMPSSYYTRAESGLYHIIEGYCETWKGWSVVTNRQSA